MTENALLNAGITAVSLFNTMLLTWLGLTVLLNADRRRAWGIWLGAGSLLMGAVFFLSHTAIIGRGVWPATWGMVFWWTIGLVPAIALPFAWYVIMLWYAGYWEAPDSALRRRQRRWLGLTAVLLILGVGGVLLGVFLLVTPRSLFSDLRFIIRWSVAGIPLLALGYSTYVVLCIGLALDALARPGPSRRVMGLAARERARPWLMATSVVLLVVSFLVAGFMLWIVQDSRQRLFIEILFDSAATIAYFDLAISGCIAIAVLLQGQAMVSYEVFTGKTLPRRGLLRHWRRAVVGAAGYSILVGASLAVDLRPLYSLLLATMLMAVFFALISWRSYAERERYIEALRPFVASQRLYEQFLSPPTTAPPDVDVALPFRALCRDVLGAQMAYLSALGPLAPLVGPPLRYPAGDPVNLPIPDGDLRQSAVAVDPDRHAGAVWAVPLWSERGLIGCFWLGPKRDGGLYTQEEIDIARVSGERLIDTKASAEMGQRLMALQRERLAQSQVIDRQTRRVLHDEILPTLQTALIRLGGVDGDEQTAAEVAGAVDHLTDAHRQISDLLREMPTTAAPEMARLGLLPALRRAVGDELAANFDEVVWEIADDAAAQLEALPTLTAEVVFYAAREAVRNAAQYGRGDGGLKRPFCLTVRVHRENGLLLEIEDNGVGLESAESAPDGSGHGLALHSTMMAVIGGELSVESAPGQFTRVSLLLAE